MANHPLQLSLQTQKGISTEVPSSLTPPVTPTTKDTSHPRQSEHRQPWESHTDSQENAAILQFTDDLEICRNADNRSVEFGRGVWSVVYKAHSPPQPSHSHPSTPPSSPTIQPQLLAVKAPLRRDANSVLRAEAQTLTRLSRIPGHEKHIVPFHGYHAPLGTLVLTALPTSLATYVEEQTLQARNRRPATPTMFDPVQGPESFKALARKLVAGLDWLHRVAGIVHGDIKPQNILLQRVEDDTFGYEPLYADFSGTVEIQAEGEPLDTTRASMSSFTPPFTAPEMLASLTAGEMAPTPASDVFSLAATLLAAATGDLLLYSNMNHRQRLEMARAGHQIVDFARSGLSGCRVPRNGFVESIVKPAVVKDPAARISTEKWLKLVSA